MIERCPFSTGISVVFAPIEITSAIYSLSMNFMLYAFKKPSWFNHPHQSLTTTPSILLILWPFLLFLSIIRHHIHIVLTSTLTLLFLVLLQIFLQRWITIVNDTLHRLFVWVVIPNPLCTWHSTFLSLLYCCTSYSFPSVSSISNSPS